MRGGHIAPRIGVCRFLLRDVALLTPLHDVSALHHPRPGKAEVVLTGAADDDVVEDADTDVLQGLGDLVGGVDAFLGEIRFLSGERLDVVRVVSTTTGIDLGRADISCSGPPTWWRLASLSRTFLCPVCSN